MRGHYKRNLKTHPAEKIARERGKRLDSVYKQLNGGGIPTADLEDYSRRYEVDLTAFLNREGLKCLDTLNYYIEQQTMRDLTKEELLNMRECRENLSSVGVSSETEADIPESQTQIEISVAFMPEGADPLTDEDEDAKA